MEIETRYLNRVFETIQDDSFYINLGLDNGNIAAIKANGITLLRALQLAWDRRGSCLRQIYAKKVRKGARLNTYIRLGFGDLNESGIGPKFVLEIWPPNHGSVIHNHGGSYGIV